MYLLTYSANWNDEISVDGFAIIDDDKKKIIVKLLKNYKKTIYINNGDDDEIEYDNGIELLEELTFDKLSFEEVEIISKFFGNYNDFGYNFLLNIHKLDEKLNIL